MFSNCFAQERVIKFQVRLKVFVKDFIELHYLKAVCGYGVVVWNTEYMSYQVKYNKINPPFYNLKCFFYFLTFCPSFCRCATGSCFQSSTPNSHDLLQPKKWFWWQQFHTLCHPLSICYLCHLRTLSSSGTFALFYFIVVLEKTCFKTLKPFGLHLLWNVLTKQRHAFRRFSLKCCKPIFVTVTANRGYESVATSCKLNPVSHSVA